MRKLAEILDSTSSYQTSDYVNGGKHGGGEAQSQLTLQELESCTCNLGGEPSPLCPRGSTLVYMLAFFQPLTAVISCRSVYLASGH